MRAKSLKRAVVAVMAVVCVSGTAQAQVIGDVDKGKAFAERTCAECHAVHAGPGASPKATATTFVNIANVPGMTATALAVFFRTPHPTMPNLVVTGEDMDNVIAYILSLKQ